MSKPKTVRRVITVARGHVPRHPAIHRTHSIDYVIVLEGEIDLLLDDGEEPAELAAPR